MRIGEEPPENARLVAAPTEVVVRMSEPIVLAGSEVHVIDRAGRDYSVGEPYLKDGDSTRLAKRVELAPNATYVVTWTALWASDGHVTHGGYGFVLGNASAPPPFVAAADGPTAQESAVRALGYASVVVAFGGLLFLLLVWRPVEAAPPRSVRTLVAAAAFGGALVALAAFALGARAAGLGPAEFAPTHLGLAALARAALLAAAGALAFLPRAQPALAAAGLAAVTFTATSHARATGSLPVMAGDALHLLAASAWVGGLAALLLALPRAREPGRVALRYSTLALASVAVVVLSGTLAGLRFVGSLDRVLTTDYGRTLLLKVALVAGMLALGALNRYVLVPAVSGTPPPAPLARLRLRARPPGTLRRAVAVETAAGFVVLAIAGVLAGTPYEDPPSPPGPFDETRLSDRGQTRLSEGLRVRLTLDPAAIGLNVANASMTRADTGATVTDVTRLQLHLNKLGPDGRRDPAVPTQTLDLDPRASGTFTGNVTFALPGTWKVTVAVERATALPDAAAFVVPVR